MSDRVVVIGCHARAAFLQARIWRFADRFYPPYVTYRALAARHDRTIPILQLAPR